MYSLDGTFPIVFLTVSCALVAAAVAETALLARFRRRNAGTVVLALLNGIVVLAVCLLFAAYLLVYTGAFATVGNAFVVREFSIPYLGRIVDMFSYWATHAFAAALLALTAASFALCCVRPKKAELASFVPVGEDIAIAPAETEAETAEAEAAPTENESLPVETEAVIVTETAPTETAAETVETEIAPAEATIVTDGAGGTAEPAETTYTRVAQAETLPIGRRHVILNRSNVVEMFSAYLKSKDDEEKARLENAINTIIVK